MIRKDIESLELENISFSYEDAGNIFENVSFTLPKSRAVWVRSPGGRGKSTLLKILSGLLSPTAGRYLINGDDVTQMSFEDFLGYRLNIGYGFDMGGLLNNKTLAENLSLQLNYHKLVSPKEAAERVEMVTELFGMQQTRDHRPFAVPGSQRKLTCVVRALVHYPQVVFLDEPLTGLKADNVTDLFHFVEDLFAHRGLRQIFFTSERADFAQRFQAEEVLISPDWFTARSVA